MTWLYWIISLIAFFSFLGWIGEVVGNHQKKIILRYEIDKRVQEKKIKPENN